MTACPTLPSDGALSITEALRAIDCQSGRAVEIAFARLFGDHGALGQALTLLLTLYVALFALNLLSGRSRLTMDMFTPRMLQLGLALTFATSWVAYQSVAWNLLVEAPDEIASMVLATHGSATQIFAGRLDGLFDVLAKSAQLAQAATANPLPGAPTPQLGGTPAKPTDLLWAASLLLLVGTVGVLIVARIALAALMALGPIFIILALFRATRGLFEGWLKAAVMLALTPVLAVLLGGATLVMISPMIASLEQAGGKVSLGLATSVFLAAFVYISLMGLAMRTASIMTSGWRLGGQVEPAGRDEALQTATGAAPIAATIAPGSSQFADERLRGVLRGAEARVLAVAGGYAGGAYTAADNRREVSNIIDGVGRGSAKVAAGRDPRIRPVSQASRARGKVSA